jgi:16S rRNA (guanine(966)-N(2))-methyltransferase RsmD
MRVIAGALKGRRLRTPHWDGVRPTSDKLRETLFNILAPRIADARVLDACAGTGALGIEAISRGARHVTFIDLDRRATALVTANLAACGVEQGYTIQSGDVVTTLRRMPAGVAFDVILLDPPYEIANAGEMLALAATRLSPDGLLVFERATRREPDVPASLVRVRDVKSGDSTLTFFKPGEPDAVRRTGDEQ